MSDAWPRFLALVRDHCGIEVDTVDPDRKLTDLGLDSMARVSLLISVEEAFGIVVPDEKLTADAFATPMTLWTMLTTVPGFPA
jgi:acyl carrier protein